MSTLKFKIENIILDGWSKTYAMTGWRIGYGVWPEKYAKIAEQDEY